MKLKEMIRKVGIYAVMVLVAAVIAGVGVPGFAEEVYGATTTYQDDDIRELGDPGRRMCWWAAAAAERTGITSRCRRIEAVRAIRS